MLRTILVTLVLVSKAASAGVWTCTAACYTLPVGTIRTQNPSFKYIGAQAPTAKEAFDKLSNSCLLMYKPNGDGVLSSGSYLNAPSSAFYVLQPVQFKDVCIKDDGEAPTTDTPAPANP